MSRILPPWAVRSLKSSVILKQNGLCVLSRNLSTALRPGVHTLPSCGSRRRVTQPPALRRSISTSNSEDFIPTSAEPISELSDEEEFPPQLCPPENFDHNDEFDSDRYVLLPVGRISREPTKANTGWRAYGKIWLRDNCQCSQCLHPDTRQRIVDIFSLIS
ncbi:hypothetical protein BJX61DRAFT_106134 [Aspergillus egyptiacus]|nr:hypothetical protein BJX61DRAFT_106134 [Aspergillus egyptiacus]